ncbi:hypothetical protein M084_0330 [Bacteroides fragilis str. 3988 T1]|nr:hypothetical protein M084_0330 [Bacteroides fragilis str. 3988 T1]RGO61741.1 hypothetical protein DXB09_07480 [Bacteroides fragilis]RGY73815.1 hypothetical protein DXA26_13460 [Bacteroides fragilis]
MHVRNANVPNIDLKQKDGTKNGVLIVVLFKRERASFALTKLSGCKGNKKKETGNPCRKKVIIPD